MLLVAARADMPASAAKASWCITAEGSSVPAGTTVMRWLTVTVFASSSSGSADGGAPKVDSNSAGSSTFYYYYD